MRQCLQTLAVWILASWVAALFAAPAAVAQLTPALHWTRAESAKSCIDPASLAERVEQLTGPVIARPSGAARTIEGHIERLASGGYRARLTVAGADGSPAGERVIEHASENCRGFDAALSFVVALMIDPELSLESLPPELMALISGEVPADERLKEELQASVTASPTSADLALSSEPSEEPKAEPEPEPELQPPAPLPALPNALGLLGVAAFSVMPEPLLGAALTFDWDANRTWGLVANVRGAASAGTMTFEEADLNGAKALAVDVVLAACVGTEPEPALRMRLCLGPEYSVWRMKGFGFSEARTVTLSGLGVSLLAELAYRLTRRVSLVAFGALRVNTLARSFLYNEDAVLHEIPRVSVLTGFGPRIAF